VQAGIDAGLRLGVTSAKQAEIKGLRAENRRLRHDVDIGDRASGCDGGARPRDAIDRDRALKSLEQCILDPFEPEPVAWGRLDDRFAGEDLARTRDLRDSRCQVEVCPKTSRSRSITGPALIPACGESRPPRSSLPRVRAPPLRRRSHRVGGASLRLRGASRAAPQTKPPDAA
jgi:hypothetical protein